MFHKGEYAAAYSGFEGGHHEDGDPLARWLREHDVTAVDVVGIATDHCVRATALDAAREGFATTVLLDLTAGVAAPTTAAALTQMRDASVRSRRRADRPVVRALPEVLRLPGVRALILVGLLARIPSVSAGVTLTLHVVLDLDRGYAAAGLVGAAATIGAALGAPLLGRLVDRRGLRPVLVLTTIAEALFWCTAGALPYPSSWSPP